MRYCAALLLLAPAALAGQAPVVTEQTSGTTALLQAVAAVNEQVAWVSGHKGTVLRTRDGGTTWELKPVPGAETMEFRDIHAFSAEEAWLLAAGPGDKSRIYHTTDGGAAWTLQFTNADTAAFFDCFTFFDAKRGVAFSDAANGRTMLMRTEDGGTSWNLLPASALPAPLPGEGAFAASGGCLVSQGKSNAWVATGAPDGRLLVTTDGGKQWKPVPTPFVKGDGAGMTATSWLDAKRGIGVGARIAQMRTDTASAVVGITEDGGATWTMRPRPTVRGSFFGVSWVPGADRNTAVAATLAGLLVTRDAGITWTAATPSQYWSVGGVGRTAWGVGPGGRITKLAF
jgi:photosystem II stability/assembly factor-like uncharacterized protein